MPLNASARKSAMMDMPAELLSAFPPSADLLLDRARREIDDEMLLEIAKADYGQDVALHLAALWPIRDQGVISAELGWHPCEVLELIRWSQPEDPTWKPGSMGRRGHQMRAFACAALLRAGALAENENYDGASSADSSLAQCLVSAKVLGDEMSEAAARFLTWRIPQLQGYRCTDRLLFDVGLLILAMRLRLGRFSDAELGIVAEWALEEEARFWQEHREVFLVPPVEHQSLGFGVKSGLWKPLGVELRDLAAAISEEAIRTEIQSCALLLDPGWNG
jgi:hypothetical protein